MHAAPSAPSDTVMPRARISATGAMPDPSFRFEPGQCSTLTSCSASSACSRVVDPHAVRGAQMRRVASPVSARYSRLLEAAGQPPDDVDLVARFSDACVCTSAWCSRRQARDRLEQLARARHGESRRERRAQPAVRPRRASACAARGSRRSTRASAPAAAPATSRVGVHHALADRRAQAALGDALRTPHRCRAPSPSSAPRSCRSSSSSVGGQPRRRRAASRACAPLPSARRACAASPSAAGRRRSRGTASGTGGCASG